MNDKGGAAGNRVSSRLRYWRLVSGYRPGALAFSTLLGTFWQIVRLASQMLVIVVIARSLGAQGYGTLAGFGGLAVILGGLTGLGSGYLLLQEVSRQRSSFGLLWRTCLVAIFASGFVLSALYVSIAQAVVRADLGMTTLVAIAISELFCYPIVYASAFAFQAHERLGWATGLPSLMALARLAGAAAFLLYSPDPDFDRYMLFHLSASMASAVIAIVAVQRLLRPAAAGRISWRSLFGGMHFSVSWLTSNAYGETDKVLTARYLGLDLAGAYAMAYRVISALSAPVAALALAIQPRLFRSVDASNTTERRRLLRWSLALAAVYSVAAGGLVVAAAPLLVWLVGEEFADSVKAVRWLAPLLLVMSLRTLAATLLSSTGRVLARARIELISAATMLASGLLLIPSHGFQGAILSLYLTELIQLGMLGAIARHDLS
ncbi:oligosaccharide flippase family protein [Lysobacter arenosi]|uniref:Oligosaccharide flippase family protein n=1 Tax=Lysobacter arenosi TaxID=2795387 RepID=A0ABX7R602_9GAMM|nr:oligosaccharide flippase family protein [Lysobacter arenosi]QSX73548.1 oligosaccharide flippase family protein [Lysobacter arenosi]